MEEIHIKTLRNKQKEKIEKATEFWQNKNINKMPEEPKKNSSKKTVKKIVKYTLLLFFIFTIGGIGGVYTDRIFIPNMLVKYPELNQYDFLKRVNERTTIIEETKEIKISQEEGISEAIEKVQPTVTEIFIKNEKDVFKKTGSGIILTSDGYILTSLKNIYTENGENSKIAEADLEIKLKNDKSYVAEIIAESSTYNLAILKIEESNLPVIPYADYQELKLGQKLIIIDSAVITDIISKFKDDYIAEYSTDSSLQNRIQIVQNLDTTFIGAAVINLRGELIGMAQGENLIIPFNEIEEFINNSIKG